MISLKELRRAAAQVRNAFWDLGTRQGAMFAIEVLRFALNSVSPERFVMELTRASAHLAQDHLATGRLLAAEQVEAWRRGSGAVSPIDFAVLYAVARALRPLCVLETGTRAGVSTTALAYALRDNGVGTVHSIDWGKDANAEGQPYLYKEIGCLIPAGLSDVVRLYSSDVRNMLPTLLEDLRPELVFLDDIHSPEHHVWEIEQTKQILPKGAVVLCDDVTRGWAEAAGTWRNCSFLGGVRL